MHKQKRLLLCNLKELYIAYKEKYPQHKVGLSKFCELRTKWCVTVSSSGTHSVCVCTHHQNTKLLVDGLCAVVNRQLKRKAKEQESEEDNTIEVEKFNVTYKDLMEKIGCDTTSLECMVHTVKIENCPGFLALETFIKNKFEELDIDDDVTYSQWESTDRTILRSHTAEVDDFIELLVYSVDNLTTHSFVVKSQSQYLKKGRMN